MNISLSDFIKFLVWLLCFWGALELSLQMISAADTFANICGVVLLASAVFVSIKTTFFINIKTKNKDENI